MVSLMESGDGAARIVEPGASRAPAGPGCGEPGGAASGACACGSLGSALPSAAAAGICCIARVGCLSPAGAERSGAVPCACCSYSSSRRRGLDKQSRARYREAPAAAAGCEASLSSLRGCVMSRFYPVFRVECDGVALPFFEPWQGWVCQTAAFRDLGLYLDDLVLFYDSVTAGAISDCVLCVFDMVDGSMVAFADGGLVAAVREPRY